MKRLLELQDASPLIERAQELIAAAEPMDASQLRGERIRRELDRPVRSTAAVWTRLPALAIAGLVLLFGASSFAALRLWTLATDTETDPPPAAQEQDVARGSRSTSETVQREPAAPSTTQPSATDTSRALPNSVVRARPSAAGFEARSSRAQRSSRRVTRASSSSREPAELETPLVPHADAEQSSRPAGTAPVIRAPGTSRDPAELETPLVKYPDAEQSSRPADAAPVASPAARTNSELVVRAVRALRREGNPALAARLLDTYRARRAADPLGEEVLALQIEAAVANADPRATGFAREYLTRYPAGRYADIARRVFAELSL